MESGAGEHTLTIIGSPVYPGLSGFPPDFYAIRSQLLSQSEAFAILMNLCSGESSYPMPEGFSTSKVQRTSTGTVTVSSQGDDVNVNQSLKHFQFQPSFCERTIIQQIALYNIGNLERNVIFTVDKEIVILGIQVHSQVHIEPDVLQLSETILSHTFTDYPSRSTQGTVFTNVYKESFYAQLLDSEGTCLTFTHFQRNVQQSSVIDIHFNLPFKVSSNRMYKLGITLHKSGWYPMGRYVNHTNKCGSITFTFCKTDLLDSCRDCFIRSIIYSS